MTHSLGAGNLKRQVVFYRRERSHRKDRLDGRIDLSPQERSRGFDGREAEPARLRRTSPAASCRGCAERDGSEVAPEHRPDGVHREARPVPTLAVMPPDTRIP